MAKNTSISLGQHFDQFVIEQIQIGRFASVSEVIRAGLRLLEEKETKAAILKRMMVEGEASGIANYDYQSLMQELDEEGN
jgi:antitoxin ParD1/3/4